MTYWRFFSWGVADSVFLGSLKRRPDEPFAEIILAALMLCLTV
jgi:hypothetical protein